MSISEIDICRTRGDTFPLDYTLRDDQGTAIDITTFSFKLTVDPSPDPTDASTNLFQLVATIVDGVNGRFQFPITTVQADQAPETYFYDLQMIDGGGNIRTIAKGKFTFTQDITKDEA